MGPMRGGSLARKVRLSGCHMDGSSSGSKAEKLLEVQLEDYGHHVFWVDDKGREIDLGAAGLRRDAEKQAELHKLIAS